MTYKLGIQDQLNRCPNIRSNSIIAQFLVSKCVAIYWEFPIPPPDGPLDGRRTTAETDRPKCLFVLAPPMETAPTQCPSLRSC